MSLARTLASSLLLAALAPQQPSSLDLAPKNEPGTRLAVHGRVVDAKGQPVAGAEIHAYQTDATGAYTREKPMDEPHARLSGWLRTDAAGRFELRTIRPGGYPKALKLGDRERHIPAHIHLDVKAPSFRERRLQAVFSDDPLLKDPYWVDWVKEQSQPVLVLRQGPGGRVTDLVIRLERAPGSAHERLGTVTRVSDGSRGGLSSGESSRSEPVGQASLARAARRSL